MSVQFRQMYDRAHHTHLGDGRLSSLPELCGKLNLGLAHPAEMLAQPFLALAGVCHLGRGPCSVRRMNLVNLVLFCSKPACPGLVAVQSVLGGDDELMR